MKLTNRRGWSEQLSAIAILSVAGVILAVAASWAVSRESGTAEAVPLADTSAAAEYPGGPFTVKLGDTALGTAAVRTVDLGSAGERLYYYESIETTGG